MLSFILGITIASLFWYYYVVMPDRKRFNEVLRSINNVVNGCEEDYMVKDVKKILRENLKS